MISDVATILTIDPANIPDEMKAAAQWVLWKAVPKVKQDGTTEFTKEPRQSHHRDRKASSTDASTWSTFEQTMSAFNVAQVFHDAEGPAVHGIGFVLGGGFAGIDIDNAISGKLVTDEANELIEKFSSYSEKSPSGTGIHIIVKGDVPNGRKFGNTEVYGAGRYFTVTGLRSLTAPATVENRQAELDELVRRIDEQRTATTIAARSKLIIPVPAAPPGPPPADPAEIFQRATTVIQGFSALWQGDTSKYDNDASRADLALAGKLAFMCGPNQHLLVADMMRDSRLVRDKWYERRGDETYLQRTIRKAYEGKGADDFFDWNCQSFPRPVVTVLENGDTQLGLENHGPLNLKQVTTVDDIGFARRLAAESCSRVRYVSTWQKWIYWDGTRWLMDDGAKATQCAQELRDWLWKEFAELPDSQRTNEAIKFIKSCGGAKHIQDIVRLTRLQAAIRITHDQLDRHPYLLNVRNGTIDLRTGVFRPHCPEDFITQIAAVDFNPEAYAAPWEKFIGEAMQGDPDLIRYLQQAGGIMLSGDVSMQALWCHYGRGSNGKSTFLSSLGKMLGDYAAAAPENFLMMKQGNTHPTELALMYGKRLVMGVECEGGRRMRESFVKQITGGDVVTCRRMKEDFWEMQPTWHLHVAYNDPPIISGTDDGIHRRLKVVPWQASFMGAKKNPRLKEQLESEEFRSGILNWCLQGFRDFQENGMFECEAVTRATEEYVFEQDLVGSFIDENCELGNRASIFFDDFIEELHGWMEKQGENKTFWTGKRISNELKRRGFKQERLTAGDDRGRTLYRGIALIPGRMSI
jgi:putative DNA primase/helicase